jgi:arsenite oxidase small subunit
MERRQFLTTCAVLSGGGFLAFDAARADTPPQLYSRTRLTDVHGRPIRARDLAVDTNYVFQYPFAATPCLLVSLSRPAVVPANLRREDGTEYAWRGGVGADRNVVAFSAICAHKLAYPTREVSFIRFQRERSATSAGQVIHCCADHSVYDPTQGARVLAGPAPQPLAAIVLEYDATEDGLYALGTQGAEQFDAFFTKYRMKLSLEYGKQGGRIEVSGTTTLRELTNYCRTTIQC